MNNRYFIRILFLAILISASILSCSSGGTSNVTVHINLSSNNQNAVNTYKSSIFEKFFRLFIKNANAQSAGYTPNITSLTLNITGSGMDDIQKTFTNLPSTISVEVPAGDSRLFEILASTPSVTFRGTANVNLAGEDSVDLPITVGLYNTKIVIPDNRNGQIIQIDDLATGNSTWTPALSSITLPYDIDFDSLGRIYIASNGAGVNEIDDITKSFKLLVAGSYVALAVDRTNNFIYYATTTVLNKSNLDGSSPTPLTTTGITAIQGIAVDSNGKLYISGNAGSVSSIPIIFYYNPVSQTIEKSVTNANISLFVNLKHVLLKPPYLYVANFTTSGTNNQILQLDLNLQLVTGYGSYVSAVNTTAGSFYGAHRFLAILNKKIYIADDDESISLNHAKIISMDNINGDNWSTYGAWGSGTGFFRFWNLC